MSKLTVEVEQDEFTAKVAQAFDLDFDGTIETEVPDFEFRVQFLQHRFDCRC
jgi:hypothetical protein